MKLSRALVLFGTAFALVLSACQSTPPHPLVGPSDAATSFTPDPAWSQSRDEVAVAFAKQGWDAAALTDTKKWYLAFGEEAEATDGSLYVTAKSAVNHVSVSIFGPSASSAVNKIVITDDHPGYAPGHAIMQFAVTLMVNPDHRVDARSRLDTNLEYDNGTANNQQQQMIEDVESFGATVLDLTARGDASDPGGISLTLSPGETTPLHASGPAAVPLSAPGSGKGFAIAGDAAVAYYTKAGFSCQAKIENRYGALEQLCSKQDSTGNTLGLGISTDSAGQLVNVIGEVKSADGQSPVSLSPTDKAFLSSVPMVIFGAGGIVTSTSGAVCYAVSAIDGSQGGREFSFGNDYAVATYVDTEHNPPAWVVVEAIGPQSTDWGRPTGLMGQDPREAYTSSC